MVLCAYTIRLIYLQDSESRAMVFRSRDWVINLPTQGPNSKLRATTLRHVMQYNNILNSPNELMSRLLT